LDIRLQTVAKHSGVPAIFGMNFQAVSVGQKLAKAGYGDDSNLIGGYLDSNARQRTYVAVPVR
jgi:hypothetical protein